VTTSWRKCFETECIMTPRGHPRSLIWALIESAYVYLVPSCPVSEILAESHFFYTPHFIPAKIYGCFAGVNSRCLESTEIHTSD